MVQFVRGSVPKLRYSSGGYCGVILRGNNHQIKFTCEEERSLYRYVANIHVQCIICSLLILGLKERPPHCGHYPTFHITYDLKSVTIRQIKKPYCPYSPQTTNSTRWAHPKVLVPVSTQTPPSAISPGIP